jgi:2'-5' RNA ligase
VALSGVVTLLPDPLSERALRLTERLEREFGLKPPEPRLPHFSHHVAGAYGEDLPARLERLAGNARPFTAWTSGPAAFVGPESVIYIAIVRSLELSRFHRWISQEITSLSIDPVPHYYPERWVPHVTLAQSPMTAEQFGQAFALLREEELAWRLPVDHVAYIEATHGGHRLAVRHQLAGDWPPKG